VVIHQAEGLKLKAELKLLKTLHINKHFRDIIIDYSLCFKLWALSFEPEI
jgi:hypothetical protein